MIEGVAAVMLGLYLLARAWGAKRLRSPRRIVASAGSYLILPGGFSGAQAVGRYRLPVMPVVCVFAAAALPRRDA